MEPAAEFSPLVLGGDVFLVDCGRKALGQSLLCSMVVIFHLYWDGSCRRRQSILCGKCVHKCMRKRQSDKFLIRYGASAILLSLPTICPMEDWVC